MGIDFTGKGFAEWMHRFLAAFRRAMPVIFFFITSYFLILLLFGLQYTIAASAITVFFSSRYRRGAGSVLGYLILILHETLIITLATIGSWNIYLGTALNILVPFILVFTQSTQFNPRGYFAYALLYVFLSLMPPVTDTDFVIELVSLWMLTLYMALVIWIWNRVHHNSPGAGMSIPEILSKLSNLVLLLIQTDRKEELEEEFGKLMRAHVVRRQSFSAMSTRDTELENMVSTLLQRFSYMIADYDWHSELDTASAMELRRLSSFLSETAKYIGTPSQRDQMEHAQELLDSMTIPEGRIRIFSRSIIHMVDFMLHTAEKDPSGDRRRSINWHGLMHEIAVRFSSESFEMRLASRLAIVMAISGIVSYLIPLSHSYWIPFNAFLLLQPSSEDSSYRMRTRPIGTFIGCIVEFAVYPLLPGLPAQIAFSLVMISLMYCSVPGTWYHPIFSTCYALTMASMTMPGTTAIVLRISYLLIAVLIVFAVNRFFLPMRKTSQFRYSVKALFRFHNKYWDIIRRGLQAETDLSISTDILSDFHMYYEDCLSYIRENDVPSADRLEEAMIILWHMFSELEQIHYLVRIKSIQSSETGQIQDLLIAIQKDLYPIIRGEDFPDLMRMIHLQRPDIAYVMNGYLRNAERLLEYRDAIPFL